MSFDFKFTDPGEGISEGEIVCWRVSEGDRVEEHQAIVEIETDKAVVEIPTPRAGVILKIAAQEGDLVQVGETLVVIGQEGESIADVPEESTGSARTVSTLVGELRESDETFEVVLAAPATRRLARELGVDLKEISGTGTGGRITEADVRFHSQKHGSQLSSGVSLDEYGEVELIPLKGVRKATAKKMIKSFSTIPHVSHMDEADISDLFDFRNSIKERVLKEKGIHMTFMPFFIKATVEAVKQFPYFNSVYDGDTEEIRLKKYYNISIAVDTAGRGLLTPVIKNADRKGLLEIARDLKQLIKRVKSKDISLAELRGGSFTITNIGVLGGIFATPIINYPEVAILGMGKIMERPMLKDGRLVEKKVLPLFLSFDHRVVDGADAVRFVNTIIERLEDISWIDRNEFD